MTIAKFLVAAATAGLVALGAAVTDGTITAGEWVAIATAAVGAVAVYLVPNRPESGR